MTDKIKSAIHTLVNATYSDEWQGNEELTKAQHLAINSLEAWEEVLNKLEKEKDFFTNINGEYAKGRVFATSEAIEIINQKLAEIEE